MRRREFVAVLPLLACFDGSAQESAPYDGVWQLDVPYKGSTHPSKFVMMKQVGNQLKVRDLQTGQDSTGMVGGGGITFHLALGGAPVPGHTASFAGVIQQGGLAGQTELAGEKYPWVAARLTSVYYCSNHKPTHIAKSQDDMEKNTKDKKCEGWRRARPDSLATLK